MAQATVGGNTVPERGRIRRRSRTQSTAPIIIAGLKREIPTYDIVSEEGLDIIEHRTDEILQEVGVEFRGDDVALEIWKQAGADVKGQRVRFDKGLVRSLLKTVPSSFVMHGRNPAKSARIGRNHLVFVPAYGSPFVSDLDQGRRYGTIKDFDNLVKLAYSSPWIHHSGGTVCEPVDQPVNKRHLDMVYAHINYSDMPFMGSVTTRDRALDSIEMAKILFGQKYTDENCVISGNINMNSPLVYDEAMSGALRAYAQANQCPVVVPFVLSGATGPVTIAGSIAQGLAEVMVGVALGQLVRPGSPAIFGNFTTTVNLRAGSPSFGTAESAAASYVVGQIARRFDVPLRCSGGFTSSQCVDAQSTNESVNSLIAAVLCGSHFVLHAAGWMESALTVSYEKFVIDADFLGALHKFVKGVSLEDEQFAGGAFAEVGPGNHFFGSTHTLANYENAFYESELFSTLPYEQWEEEGSLDIAQRANLKWKQMLKDYQKPELDPGVDEELQAFIQRRKSEMPDIWH
ncbi:MAG: trimethylamine methyltransferase family protein [Acidiferrobacterales bacterium]|nr:trimethylamine methyltransferase family protein [Acidiferrobacterales bacterium]